MKEYRMKTRPALDGRHPGPGAKPHPFAGWTKDFRRSGSWEKPDAPLQHQTQGISFLLHSVAVMLFLYSCSYILNISIPPPAMGYGGIHLAGGVFVFLLRILYPTAVIGLMIRSRGTPRNPLNFPLLLPAVLQGFGMILWLIKGHVFGRQLFEISFCSLLVRAVVVFYGIVKLTEREGPQPSLSPRRSGLVILRTLAVNSAFWLIEDSYGFLTEMRLPPVAGIFFHGVFCGLAMHLIVRTFKSGILLESRIEKGAFIRNAGFSLREQEVFELLVTGARYKSISETLNISVDTVKTHASRIYRKSGISGKEALTRLFEP